MCTILFLGSLEPVLLDTCQNGVLKQNIETNLWMKDSHIPDTLPDCTFKFCARVAEPYINPGCKTGLEIDIIKVLQDKLEFKVCTITFFLCSQNVNFAPIRDVDTL